MEIFLTAGIIIVVNLIVAFVMILISSNATSSIKETIRKETQNTIPLMQNTILDTTTKIKDIEAANLRMQGELKETLTKEMLALRDMNDQQLRELRGVVDEKLSTTLTKNLNESFRTVSVQLSSLYNALGEMKEMNTDVTKNVTSLTRALNNVKVRGTWAEVQLGNILDETIPGMYVTNYRPAGIVALNQDVVEFAIKIPSNDGNITYLPVDSKLPIEDYIRLQEANDTGNVVEADAARKALEARVLSEAKDVSKYIHVPETTPYAILYLATEGLYAEILSSKSGVYDKIRNLGILVAGPNTITALLSSLAMGYRAIAINNKADEVRQLLAVTKAQYSKFTDLLAKAKKNIDTAAESLELAQKRNEIMTKKLKSIDELSIDSDEVISIDNEVETKM